jgi:hypothetical protein
LLLGRKTRRKSGARCCRRCWRWTELEITEDESVGKDALADKVKSADDSDDNSDEEH